MPKWGNMEVVSIWAEVNDAILYSAILDIRVLARQIITDPVSSQLIGQMLYDNLCP